MKGPIREIKPGEVFYLFNERLHFVGIAESKEDKVYVFWGWNKWKRRRYYEAKPLWLMELEWGYMSKTKKRVK